MDCSSWVGDFLAYLSADRACSSRTTEIYGSCLQEFADFFGSVDEEVTWETLDGDIVRRWLVALMDKGIQPSSVKRRLSALRSFYRYLKLTKRVENNPLLRVQSPKSGKPLPKFFRDDDINQLLDCLRDEALGGNGISQDAPIRPVTTGGQDGEEPDAVRPAYERYKTTRAYLIILMLYMTGMRVSELVGMNVGDVDYSARQLKVTGKRNKQRLIPAAAPLLETLKAYLPLREAELARLAGKADDDGRRALLLSAKGGRMGIRAVQQIVHDVTGMVTTQQKRSPHVFRHTFATSMINDGCDLQSVKELLGHVSLATTEVYTHTNFKELQRIYSAAHPRA